MRGARRRGRLCAPPILLSGKARPSFSGKRTRGGDRQRRQVRYEPRGERRSSAPPLGEMGSLAPLAAYGSGRLPAAPRRRSRCHRVTGPCVAGRAAGHASADSLAVRSGGLAPVADRERGTCRLRLGGGRGIERRVPRGVRRSRVPPLQRGAASVYGSGGSPAAPRRCGLTSGPMVRASARRMGGHVCAISLAVRGGVVVPFAERKRGELPAAARPGREAERDWR
jgi:hypothetical protein